MIKMIFLDKLKKWLRVIPNRNDICGVNIREMYQSIFPCKHEWYHKPLIVHGENHGQDLYERHCRLCGDRQKMVYKRIGNTRYEWISMKGKGVFLK